MSKGCVIDASSPERPRQCQVIRKSSNGLKIKEDSNTKRKGLCQMSKLSLYFFKNADSLGNETSVVCH